MIAHICAIHANLNTAKHVSLYATTVMNTTAMHADTKCTIAETANNKTKKIVP